MIRTLGKRVQSQYDFELVFGAREGSEPSNAQSKLASSLVVVCDSRGL